MLADVGVVPLFSDVIADTSLSDEVCANDVSSLLVNVEAVSLLTKDVSAMDAETVALLSEITVVSSLIVEFETSVVPALSTDVSVTSGEIEVVSLFSVKKECVTSSVTNTVGPVSSSGGIVVLAEISSIIQKVSKSAFTEEKTLFLSGLH